MEGLTPMSLLVTHSLPNSCISDALNNKGCVAGPLLKHLVLSHHL